MPTLGTYWFDNTYDRQVGSSAVLFLASSDLPSESETAVGSNQAAGAGSALSEDEVVDRITAMLRQKCGRGGFQNFKRLLISMDKSGDNELSARELQEGLRAMGIKVPARDIAALMTFFDEDRSGSISLAEFTKGMRPHLRGKRSMIAKVRPRHAGGL